MAKPGTTRVEKRIRSLFPDGVISRVQVLSTGTTRRARELDELKAHF
jgi:hypothetical protein